MPDAWTDRLSAFIDGELEAEEQRALELHLAECSDCRANAAALRDMQQWAATYPGRPVHADVWNGVAGAIRSRRAVDLPTRAGRRGYGITLPLALAASVVLLLVGSVSWWAARATAPGSAAPAGVSSTELFAPRQAQAALLVAERYGAAVAQLEQALLQDGVLDSATIRVVRSKLEVIDRAIGEAREALAKDPGSAYLADHFASMMRRKLNLLRSASAVRSS